MHPRDAFGFNGGLINRRRIMRRDCLMASMFRKGSRCGDEDERGIIFMALNASIFRQFEFVQQQWIEYGNDSHQGNDKDLLLGKSRGQRQIRGAGHRRSEESAVHLRRTAQLCRTARRRLFLHPEPDGAADDRDRNRGPQIELRDASEGYADRDGRGVRAGNAL